MGLRIGCQGRLRWVVAEVVDGITRRPSSNWNKSRVRFRGAQGPSEGDGKRLGSSQRSVVPSGESAASVPGRATQ